MSALQMRVERFSRRFAERRQQSSSRREHDMAMRDPRMAAEHHAQIAHEQANGRPGCMFCS